MLLRCCSHRAARVFLVVLVVPLELFVPSAPHAKYLTITHHWQKVLPNPGHRRSLFFLSTNRWHQYERARTTGLHRVPILNLGMGP